MAKFGRDIAILWAYGGRRLRGEWRRLLIGLVLVGALVMVVLPFDAELLQASRIANEKLWTHRAARGISFWGDFYTGTALLAGLFWVGGLVCKSRRWRMVGVNVLAAAALAGIVADVIQMTVGRPRPSAGLPDGLYGFHVKGDYHGFPSGHAATAMGTAAAIAFSYPPAAIPAYLGGLSVGWARVELNRHHWTDIIAGSALGVGAGYLLAGRRRRPGSRPR